MGHPNISQQSFSSKHFQATAPGVQLSDLVRNRQPIVVLFIWQHLPGVGTYGPELHTNVCRSNAACKWKAKFPIHGVQLWPIRM